jgi:hypothetical protein
MSDFIADGHARGRTITVSTTRSERLAKRHAMLWMVARAAARIADDANLYSRGLYEIHPALMLRLREAVDRIRPDMKRMEAELASGGDQDAE